MSIAPDGTVTIVAHRSEMGCGSRTALPLIVADELDADWSKVKIEQAIGDPKYGEQDTDGSHSVRSNFDLDAAGGRYRTRDVDHCRGRAVECFARKIARPNRILLCIALAAASWDMAKLAAAAAKLPVPKKEDTAHKNAREWRYIGKESEFAV